jgi:hypothetical protein
MYFKPILLILFISIVSAEELKIEKHEGLKDLPDKNEVLETLIGSINVIRGNLENVLKTLTETNLLNRLQDQLLRLVTSMDLAIGYQYSLLDQLGGAIKQTTDASAKLNYLIENSGNVDDFVKNFIVPLITSLKNLEPKLSQLMDANGINFYHGEIHGNHGHGDPSALHGNHHGGEHNHGYHGSNNDKVEGDGDHGGHLNDHDGKYGNHKQNVRRDYQRGQHKHGGDHNNGGHDKNHLNRYPLRNQNFFS